MPTLNLFTNVPVDTVVAADILKDASKAVSKILGKPESVKFSAPFPSSLSLLLVLALEACLWLFKGTNLHFSSSMVQYVMILLNGGTPIIFATTEEPAAYGELISIGGLGPGVNGKLSSTIAEILQTKIQIDGSRFYIKFYDVQASFSRPFNVL
ncbi:macrophage migration inhibitory factor-like protein [Cucumis melo var. makuwa]|uniref:L-dopachrome isomerase n=1 Tax=Cucumis melo var. makuwa TaxID=1194695 RepID=A0A5A7UXJ9_CUCMM|nr:macrophage migration inhibitory factor-like protein [Cucumis melo var. makuwa]